MIRPEFGARGQSKTPPKCSDTIQSITLHVSSADKLDDMEREVAELTWSLLKEDLVSECTKLLDYINPYLSTYTKEKLEEKIMTKIQT